MTEIDSTPHYEIRVKGHLSPSWASWFDGFTITNEPGGASVIRGPVVDQAALHGLLLKLRDLGIGLESLTQLAPDVSPDAGERHVPSATTNRSGATK